MSKSVKTTNDWMSLFLGSRSGSSSTGAYSSSSSHASAYSRDSDSTVTSRYSRDSDLSLRQSRDSDLSSRYSRVSDVSRYSPSAAYSSSRYSGSSSITSPPTVRSDQGYSSYSRFLPTSRWTEPNDDENDYRTHDQNEHNSHGGRQGATEIEQQTHIKDGRQNKTKKGQVSVLNEGTIIIRRQGAAVDTSDEESDAEEDIDIPPEVVEEKPEPPPRDPLDVEEEALTEKLQTAGFLMSMPEEEQIKKRLLEIKQMRDNPEMFKPENTRNFKFSQVSSEVAKPSTAKEEEEKILLLVSVK